MSFPKPHLTRAYGQFQDGNVISVRLCARFLGWEIFARSAYLVIELGDASKIQTYINLC